MNVVSGSCIYKQAVSSQDFKWRLPSFKSYWTQSTTLDMCNSKGCATLFLAFEKLTIYSRNKLEYQHKLRSSDKNWDTQQKNRVMAQE